jgi:hypothetical protein
VFAQEEQIAAHPSRKDAIHPRLYPFHSSTRLKVVYAPRSERAYETNANGPAPPASPVLDRVTYRNRAGTGRYAVDERPRQEH